MALKQMSKEYIEAQGKVFSSQFPVLDPISHF